MTDRIEEVFNCWADKMTAGDVPAMGLKAFRAAVAEILRIQVEQCQQQGEPVADQPDTQRESE